MPHHEKSPTAGRFEPFRGQGAGHCVRIEPGAFIFNADLEAVFIDAEGDAQLTIIVDTIKHPQGVYLFTVTVSVVQTVKLTRKPKGDDFPSETWKAIALGLTTPKQIEVILEPLKEKLGSFTEAWRSVNPKD